MHNTLALSVPHPSSTVSRFRVALVDVTAGLRATEIWGRLGWRDTKRRYTRTVIGPFWTTLSLAIFVGSLGFIWANLWGKDPRSYLPFLTSGMMCWMFFLAVCTEGCPGFIAQEYLIKQLRVSYTLLGCATVWRNAIVFAHNLIIYILICIYGGVQITWATLLVIPGFALLAINTIWIVTVLSTACARYRDLQPVVTNLLQISMFLTPIFWSPDQLSGRTAVLAEFNPLYQLISVVREPMLGRSPAALSWVFVIAIAVVGWTGTIRMLTSFRHRIVYWI
jgi:ABC-type polysaccharide/polyol phosphate export permease